MSKEINLTRALKEIVNVVLGRISARKSFRKIRSRKGREYEAKALPPRKETVFFLTL
jgi:thymidine kinase